MKTTVAGVVLFWLAVAVQPCQGAAAAAKVVIGHAAMNARVAPLWVAEDHGFFQKYGITANAIFIRQAPVLVAALTAGDVQAAYTGETTLSVSRQRTNRWSSPRS